MSDKQVKVLHIITTFALGGAQDYLITLVKGLDRRYFEPVVAGGMTGEWASLIASETKATCIDVPSLRREISPLHDLWSVAQLYRLCQTLRPNIVHTHSSKAGVVGRIAAAMAGVNSIVHTVHGFPFHDFMPSWKRKSYVEVERKMALSTTKLIFVSDRDRRQAEQLRIFARKGNNTIYYGIDTLRLEKQINRNNVRSVLGFGKKDLVLGFTGRFDQQKAVHVLMDAFARVFMSRPHLRLLLVGDGPQRLELENLRNSLGLNNVVVITGFRDDVPNLLKAMDVFVMTSLWEGLSRSLAEAMCAELPVIATDVGGTSDAVTNGVTGLLIPPNDPEAAATAILSLVDNPEYAKNLGRAAYKFATKKFSVEVMKKNIQSLYKEVSQNSKRAASLN